MSSAPWINDFNARYLHSVGPDGQYNRDRLFKQIGVDPTRTISLTGAQRQQMKALIERETGQKLNGVDIDTAGNLNEPEGFGHYAKKYGPIAGGIALTAFGIPGLMPGLIGGAGGAAAGAGAGLGSTVAPGVVNLANAASTAAAGAVPAVGGGMGGLGSILGTIGKSALSSLKADPLGTLGDLGGIMGHAAQGSANQRTAENRSALDYGLLQQRGANDQFSNDLKSADYAREGQDRARRSAILSALLSGVTDASIVPGNPRIAAKMPTMTGGLRPSALAGSKDSLLALIGGQTDPMAPKYQAPALPQLQQAGGFEKTLGGLGLGSSILGALGRKQQPPPIMS